VSTHIPDSVIAELNDGSACAYVVFDNRRLYDLWLDRFQPARRVDSRLDGIECRIVDSVPVMKKLVRISVDSHYADSHSEDFEYSVLRDCYFLTG
jgi:hypothetical protein